MCHLCGDCDPKPGCEAQRLWPRAMQGAFHCQRPCRRREAAVSPTLDIAAWAGPFVPAFLRPRAPSVAKGITTRNETFPCSAPFGLVHTPVHGVDPSGLALSYPPRRRGRRWLGRCENERARQSAFAGLCRPRRCGCCPTGPDRRSCFARTYSFLLETLVPLYRPSIKPDLSSSVMKFES